MDRRSFLAGLVGLLAAPLAPEAHVAHAQPSPRIPHIVFQGLSPIAPGDNETVFQPFRNGMRELGYVEGRNFVFEYQHVDRKLERLPGALQELARRGIDVIVCGQPQVALAAIQATPTTPIVFAAIIDPIGAGIVRSLAKPGGNVTGLAWDSDPQITAKQLQLLREIVPTARTLGLLWNPEVQGSAAFVHAAEGAATASGIALRSIEVRTPAAIDGAFAHLARDGIAGVIVLGSAFTWEHRQRLADLATAHRVSAIFGNRDSVLAGGLMSYGPSLADQFRRAASYVDKILKGAKPADLPVEQPTRFPFIINLKTAKALGLAIPPSVLARADEVIQ